MRARRTSRKVAVLFLDLDRFKHVNDSMGHAIGDRVLKAVGERLRRRRARRRHGRAARRRRIYRRARGHPPQRSKPNTSRESHLDVFSEPLDLESGQQVVISPSIGISLYPDHAQVPTDLVKYADTAMYQAKEAGRNMYMLYYAGDGRRGAAARRRCSAACAWRWNATNLAGLPADARSGSTDASPAWRRCCAGAARNSAKCRRRFHPARRRSRDDRSHRRIRAVAGLRAAGRVARSRHSPTSRMSVNLSALQLLRDELTQRLCEVLAEFNLDAATARAGTHRKRADGQSRTGDPYAGSSARARRQHRDRRFRHRLFVAELSETSADRHARKSTAVSSATSPPIRTTRRSPRPSSRWRIRSISTSSPKAWRRSNSSNTCTNTAAMRSRATGCRRRCRRTSVFLSSANAHPTPHRARRDALTRKLRSASGNARKRRPAANGYRLPAASFRRARAASSSRQFSMLYCRHVRA